MMSRDLAELSKLLRAPGALKSKLPSSLGEIMSLSYKRHCLYHCMNKKLHFDISSLLCLY